MQSISSVGGRLKNPFADLLAHQDAVILDGGLASQLEWWGYDLRDPLWSARLLIEEPSAIRRVHEAYLRAGADCIISSSYQASIPGFLARGMNREEAENLLRLSVKLAVDARDDYWSHVANRIGRQKPLVAASVGPYGAFLADGSEYSGLYSMEEGELVSWHRDRWHILANSGADLLACETIPSRLEALALLRLLRETPLSYAWFSFSCQDGSRISDGTAISECVEPLKFEPQVAAIGVNCTAPRFVPELIAEIHSITDKPIVVYPNSGERYDATLKKWFGYTEAAEFGTYSREWRKAGAALIGGCCRTGPAHVRQIADRMRRKKVN